MKGEKSDKNRKDSILQKFGLCSFLIGVLFWSSMGLVKVDRNYLDGVIWDTLNNILESGVSEQWILLGVFLIILPIVSYSLGLLFGVIGLWTPNRKFAILGLIVNGIVPVFLYFEFAQPYFWFFL